MKDNKTWCRPTDGYDNAIMLTHQGKVSEGPGSCLFMVRSGDLITPTVTSDILESITRDTLIQLQREHAKKDVIQRDVDRTELYIADELFFCGSGYEIIPITNVDGYTIGDGKPGKVTRNMMDIYFNLVTGKDPAHTEWRVPVYDKS